MLLMDRVFRRRGVVSSELTAMDRLSYVGERGTGALAYAPVSEFAPKSPDEVDVWELGECARGLFDGGSDEVLPALAVAGSSGGARPKAQIYLPADERRSDAGARPGPGGLSPAL